MSRYKLYTNGRLYPAFGDAASIFAIARKATPYCWMVIVIDSTDGAICFQSYNERVYMPVDIV